MDNNRILAALMAVFVVVLPGCGGSQGQGEAAATAV